MNSFYLKFLKFRLKYFPRFAKKKDFRNVLEAQGIDVGEHTIFYSSPTITVDVTRPFMIHIGDYCKITAGCVILAHDYSRSVMCGIENMGNVGEAQYTWIGDNCFIGMNSIILMGAHIGNNTIVGAGSVVSGEFEGNCVIAGNPARKICTINEFYEKRKKRELNAAKLYVREYQKKYKRDPTINDMTNAFSWLYLERSEKTIEENPELFALNGVNIDVYKKIFMNSLPTFENFESFLGWCKTDNK